MTTALSTPTAIAQFRLAAITRAARFRADHGMDLMRGLTVAKCREQFEVPGRTWSEVADSLAALEREVEIRTAECVWIDESQSVCTFWPAGTVARLESECGLPMPEA